MKQELYSEAVLNLAASVGNPAIHGWEEGITFFFRNRILMPVVAFTTTLI
ncbi:hypothetical protein HYX16_06060 [Candidatus Woesearchaeota archaeon]|nr:hypothetical protein [Candidatus Woesearchaeota archaeon]